MFKPTTDKGTAGEMTRAAGGFKMSLRQHNLLHDLKHTMRYTKEYTDHECEVLSLTSAVSGTRN